MAIRLTEFFGYSVGSEEGLRLASQKACPFVPGPCIKPAHGACALEGLKDKSPVICCPNRLYVDDFKILKTVADLAFEGDCRVISAGDARTMLARDAITGNEVVAFGRYLGQELPLPKAGKSIGSYYMDWVLVRLDANGAASELTALEVQTIDTTGSYFEQSKLAFSGNIYVDSKGRVPGYSHSGFNWENVNKRILPQIIYKGHALRREELCKKGLFFACPVQILSKIMDRLGGTESLHKYQMQPGAITFLGYELAAKSTADIPRSLNEPTVFTTTIDQIALAFTSPRNLPDAGVYAQAANLALRS